MRLPGFVAPCPYCYTDIDLRRVAFRCLGRPVAGKEACGKEVDKARETHFGDLNEYYPAFTLLEPSWVREARRAECPRCLGPTGVRLCPQCHSRLPDGFSHDSPLFGLVGARSSGKTVMLAVLMRELATNGPIGRRFGHVITVYGAGEENGQAAKLKNLLDQMESTSGQLPPQTQQAAGEKTTPVVFEWKIARDGIVKAALGDYKSTVFSFYDTAGEDLAADERALSMTYLLATDGIILLLDPFSFPGNAGHGKALADQRVETSPENVLHAITEVLRQNERVKRNRKIKQPVAVVISKIDAFWGDVPQNNPIRRPSSKLPYFDEEEAASVHDHIASLVAHWGGDGLLAMLDTNYANYRFFGLSALGAEPDYSTQRVDERGVIPHRVGEPLLWLMAERGFVPRQR